MTNSGVWVQDARMLTEMWKAETALLKLQMGLGLRWKLDSGHLYYIQTIICLDFSLFLKTLEANIKGNHYSTKQPRVHAFAWLLLPSFSHIYSKTESLKAGHKDL